MKQTQKSTGKFSRRLDTLSANVNGGSGWYSLTMSATHLDNKAALDFAGSILYTHITFLNAGVFFT